MKLFQDSTTDCDPFRFLQEDQMMAENNFVFIQNSINARDLDGNTALLLHASKYGTNKISSNTWCKHYNIEQQRRNGSINIIESRKWHDQRNIRQRFPATVNHRMA
jgi:hypothetical protein